MATEDDTRDVWARLRAYCEELSTSLWYPHREYDRRPRLFRPATEEQLRAAEERLGFPLPPDLRRFYAEIADGGLSLADVEVFPGVEDLASAGNWNWRLHPRIEEALLRHPNCYVVVDSLPQTFLQIGWDRGGGSTAISLLTGCVYDVCDWDELPDVVVDNAPYEPFPLQLQFIQLAAPSLGVWFDRWLNHRWLDQLAFFTIPLPEKIETAHTGLLPEMVETGDLPDPDIVWRGIYRFGPGWHLWEWPPDDADLAYDAEHAIYWAYIDNEDFDDACEEQ